VKGNFHARFLGGRGRVNRLRLPGAAYASDKMSTITRISLLVLMATMLLSCSQHSAVEQRAQAYLQPLLHSGESTTNIIARFGTPFGQAKTSVPGLTTWSFQLPDKDRAALPAEVFGFTAFVTNSQLVSWEPIYQK
jgi:hypothetical protein